jgi:RNA polymerase sigma factor (sigma-70 family)
VPAAPTVDFADLAALRGLARSLVTGDADADDLVQDTAVAALEHPPAPDRPARPWLAAILRNRWRMDRRADARRRDREAAVALTADEVAAAADELVTRARTLERLAAALVALDEPFRTALILRYIDGHSAADIAALLGVPAGTVRWRLKTGRDRLRAALDQAAPRRAWAGAILAGPFVPAVKGLALMKAKTQLVLAIVVALAMLAGGVAIYATRDRGGTPGAPSTAPRTGSGAALARGTGDRPGGGATPDIAVAVDEELSPGQARAAVEGVSAPGGMVTGRVINWSTGDGVTGAELVFDGPDGAVTVRSDDHGRFALAPANAGRFRLATATAPGFLPYAPEWQHSSISVDTWAERKVLGVTVFLFPALDYTGVVVDGAGKPVAGAAVKLLGSPAGEQAIERLVTEWTTDKDGTFTFHAPDDTVFEATSGKDRGRARLDGDVQLTRQLVIQLRGDAAADLTISGKVVDESGAPLADVLLRAEPLQRMDDDKVHAVAFAVSGADGRFVVSGIEPMGYDLSARADDRAPAVTPQVTGGARDVTLVLAKGPTISGAVTTTSGEPVPAFTLVVFRRDGVGRDVVLAKSIVHPGGVFEIPIREGAYELVATAGGWAASKPTPAQTGDRDVAVTLSAGAVLRGRVVSAKDQSPLAYARVMREALSGGASAQPSNAGTVTREDGTFELSGIPPGPVSVTVVAGGHHPRIEAGLVATDGGVLGPVTVALTPLAPGEKPLLELVGIGVALSAHGDLLAITKVMEGGGAAKAGIVLGDKVAKVDGVSVTELGLDGAVARIRGAPGTTVRVTIVRVQGGETVELVVERVAFKSGG